LTPASFKIGVLKLPKQSVLRSKIQPTIRALYPSRQQKKKRGDAKENPLRTGVKAIAARV